MSITNLNPEFSGLGVITPNPPIVLSLYGLMPIGKHKGTTIEELIVGEPSYMRWFVDNVDKYTLSPEAMRMLYDIEEEQESPAPKAADDCWNNTDVHRWDPDDDIPF